METEEERDTRLRNKWLTRFATELEKFTVMMEKDKPLRADPELTLDILLNAGVRAQSLASIIIRISMPPQG